MPDKLGAGSPALAVTPSLSGILPLPALCGKSKCQPRSARKNQPQGRAGGEPTLNLSGVCPVFGCGPRPLPSPPSAENQNASRPNFLSGILILAGFRLRKIKNASRPKFSLAF